MSRAILILIALAVMAGCKKDYQDDIPEWLENRIKSEKKNCRDKDSCLCNDHEYCYTINEYKDSTNAIIYEFQIGAPPGFEYYYEEGELICEGIEIYCFDCPDICDIEYVRQIWQQHPK